MNIVKLGIIKYQTHYKRTAMKKILAFSGSNNQGSINQILIRLCADKIDKHHITVIELTDYYLPLYSADLEKKGFPEALLQFKALFDAHDAYIIASPEHNGMMPAVLKNTFDWLSRMADPLNGPMFNNKPVLLLSTSPGVRGGATNLENMAIVMPYWGADIKGYKSFGEFNEIYQNDTLAAKENIILQKLVDDFQKNII